MEMSSSKSNRWEQARLVRALIVATAACVLGAAVPAWAAQVVDVRVGQHAGFSRVVFELDSPVGYKVERRRPDAGADELVISLDAGAEAKTVDRGFDFIESLVIVPGTGSRSTVRVRLKGEDLKLKEMILANPPRIVLDVHRETATVAVQAEPTDAPAADEPVETSQPPASMPSGAAGNLGEEESKLALAANSSAAPPVLQQPSVAKPSIAPPRVQRHAADADGPQQPTIKLRRDVPPRREAARAYREKKVSLRERSPILPKNSPSSYRSRLSGSSQPPAPKPAENARPKPAALPAKPEALSVKPGKLPPPAEGKGLFKLTNVTVGAAGLLLLVGAGLVLMRRRNTSEAAEAGGLENPRSDDDGPFAPLELSVGSVAGDEIEAEIEEIPLSEAGQAELGVPVPDDASDSQGTASAGGADMGTVSSDHPQGIVVDVSSAATMAGAGDSASLIVEFERRMALMEKRIDELVDSNERLERQVVAQTEELRVQRAAIARTQRAVRNLSRPVEDAPTEPALRDPLRPEGPREV